MRVEKIELIGFKSFSERTVFNLHPGITCIVGPNGCGKSNVVDAFKWVLGEQSAKSLRGDKMEEVIFNGSQTKKPKGMAEVTLFVSGLESDNGGEKITTVTRRLYRSGDSDYLIGRELSRLKDIRDIFLDTGLEIKSYSILEQDRIGAIINSKPEEKRFLIEEVAGVVKYKVRRAEAESKLEGGRLNLQRITDIIAEVKRQINSIDRQVKKAIRYKRLMEELQGIELRLTKRDYTELMDNLNKILKEYDAIKEEEALLRAELTSTEADIELKRLALLEKEKKLNALQTEFQARERDIADIDREIAVLKTDRDNLILYLARLRQEEEEVREKIKNLEVVKTELNDLKEKISLEADSLKNELNNKNALLGISSDDLSEKEKLIELKRKEAFSVAEGLSLLKNELSIKNSSLENLTKKKEKAEREYDSTKGLLEELNSSLKELQLLIFSMKEELLTLHTKRDSTEKEINSYREKRDSLMLSLSSKKEELVGSISRLESLKELAEEKPPLKINPITTITEIIDVPLEYEKALESALMDSLNGFILKTYEDIESACSLLREKNSPRTALIPLDVRRRPLEKELPEGILGRAEDLLSVKDEFSHIIKNLLSNVLIVRSLRDAIRINNSHFTLVTLEGEVVEPSGTVIAGSDKGLLKRKRQIKEIIEEIALKRSNILLIQSEMDNASTLLREKEGEIQEINNKIIASEKEIGILRLRSERAMEEVKETETRLSYIKVEIDDTKKEIESIEKAINEGRISIKEAEEKRTLTEDEVSAFQEEILRKRTIYEEQRVKTVDIRLSLNSCNERIDSTNKELKGIERQIGELSEKTEFIKKELSETELKIRQKEDEITEKEGRLKDLLLKADSLKQDISSLKETTTEEGQWVYSADHRRIELRNQIESISSRLSSLEVQRVEHKLRIENLLSTIKGSHGVLLNEIDVEPPIEDDGERLLTLREKVQELGPVSLGALDEHEELQGRYEFLTKQKADVEQSIAELEEAITRINSTTRKRLKEAYEALNMKFKEIFSLMFGGGKAELRLTDEGNILETGIDIVAQPYGKRLQNINLLSGGEKTLTALAILFASFLLKPTPLCILDEADSALDEANTEKFSRMLKELSKDTQFIVITHNRATVEIADYIYGITMEEPGISKIISLRFSEV